MAVAITTAMMLYLTSSWWERALATFESSRVSPDGCIRVDTLKPFWILPSELHRLPNPDPGHRHELGLHWDSPMFQRAYEVSTDILLGETIVFDVSSGPANYTSWDAARTPGRREVRVNGFLLMDSTRCAEKATLEKLNESNRVEWRTY
jgi:hypothetical protein